MSRSPTIGVVAPSSAVPPVELARGVRHLRDAGFDVRVHPQCGQRHFTFAGTDAARVGALWEVASDPKMDVVWCARGGYGVTRLLPMLDALAAERGAPPAGKLLVGYSDATALHEYVRGRWGWATLHAPMPSAPEFGRYEAGEWAALLALVRGGRVPANVWTPRPLRWMTAPPAGVIRGEMVGGNLSLWAALAGTPYAPTAGAGRIVFLEDVGEPFHRLDRLVTQVRQAGLLEGAAAVVLGDFTDYKDEPPRVAASDEPGAARVPLRAAISLEAALAEVFGGLGMPVAAGLPVGHGPGFAPLPLGAVYELTREGRLGMVEWGWASRAHG